MPHKKKCENHGYATVYMDRLYKRGTKTKGGLFLSFAWWCPKCLAVVVDTSVKASLVTNRSRRSTPTDTKNRNQAKRPKGASRAIH